MPSLYNLTVDGSYQLETDSRDFRDKNVLPKSDYRFPFLIWHSTEEESWKDRLEQKLSRADN